MKMSSEMFYQSNESPFGRTWEKCEAKWCEWMLSVPKKNNPSMDVTGKSILQVGEDNAL
jgi:hypothetical protein